MANICSLSDYDIELSTKAAVEIEGNRTFFEQAKALLKEARFVTLLAEAKSDQLRRQKGEEKSYRSPDLPHHGGHFHAAPPSK